MGTDLTLDTIKEFTLRDRVRRIRDGLGEPGLRVFCVTQEEWNSLRRTWSEDIPDPSGLGSTLFGVQVVVDERRAALRKSYSRKW